VIFCTGLGVKYLTLRLRRSGDGSKEKNGNQKKPECRDHRGINGLQSGGSKVGPSKNGKAKDKKNTLYRVFLGVKGRKLSTSSSFYLTPAPDSRDRLSPLGEGA